MTYVMNLQPFNDIFGRHLEQLEQEISNCLAGSTSKKEERMPRIPLKRNMKLIREAIQAFLDSKNLSGVGFTIERNEYIASYVIRFDPVILLCVHYGNAHDTIREGTLMEFLQVQFKDLSIVRKLRLRERKRMQHAASEYDEIIAAQDLMP